MEALESNRMYSPPRSGMALGRIIRVDAEKRYCDVRTFFGEPGFNDLYISNCQWISPDAHPSGSESTNIPRKGSCAVIMFIEGKPLICGYYRPEIYGSGASNPATQTRLNEGDKIISTSGENFIAVKGNGAIEIRSKDGLKTIYFPKENLLSTVCGNNYLECDGGYSRWDLLDKSLNTTLLKSEYRKDMARTCCIVEEKGYVDGFTVSKTTVGPILPGEDDITVPVYTSTQDILGTIKAHIGPEAAGIDLELNATGEVLISNKFGSINLMATGDWSIKTPTVTVELSSAGDTSIKGPVGSISSDKSGNIEAKNAVASLSIKDAGDFEIKNAAATMKASASGDVEASNTGMCALTMKSAGEVLLTGPVGKMKIDSSGKIGLGGAAAELFDLFDKFLDAFINQANLCMTGTGPSGPLNPPAMTSLVQIKTLLGTIKGSI